MTRERSMNALANRHRRSAIEGRVTLVNILTAALDSQFGVCCEVATPDQAKNLQSALLAIRRNFPGTAYQDFKIVIPPQAPNCVWLIPTKLDTEETPRG